MTIDFEDRHSIDNPDYNWYVVNEDGILTGNEFREDAQDAMEDLPPQGGPYKIYARRTLVRYGWDPSDNKNWLGGNISVKRPSSPYGKNPGQLDDPDFPYMITVEKKGKLAVYLFDRLVKK